MKERKSKYAERTQTMSGPREIYCKFCACSGTLSVIVPSCDSDKAIKWLEISEIVVSVHTIYECRTEFGLEGCTP